MADYEGNGLAAFNDARSRGWGGSVTLADLERLSAGNPIAHGIAAVWPDAPPSRMDQAYQTSIDRWKQLGKDAFFAPANSLKAFMDQPTFNNALGVMPMGGIGKMPIGPPTGIRAYHGSPYDFDRFDMSRIGTGEGAQAYGHGLYFAENPAVAQSYKTTGMNSGQSFAAEMLRRTGGNRAAAMAELRKAVEVNGNGTYGTDMYRHALDALEANAPLGKMYEVNINAKPEQFLDWDRQLPMDSPARAAALDAIKKPGIFTSEPERTLRATGREAIEGNPALTGQGLYGSISRRLGGGNYRDPQASDVLRDAGFPGIRYLDQGSRGYADTASRLADVRKAIQFAEGRPELAKNLEMAKQHEADLIKQQGPISSNYVLFNDKIVDIMKKWSLAGAIPFAAASDYDGRF